MIRNLLIGMVLFGLSAVSRAADPLVVHEWGTFTSLQDEQGTALGRINTDDEPVPSFVHQITEATLFPPTSAFTTDAKGVPSGDPNVTMRLETPVLYFHLPKNQAAPLTFDVKVAFQGGWLTQYFPDALADIDGKTPSGSLPALTAKTVGQLTWHSLSLNANQGTLPQTDQKVWTAPRAVDSALISKDTEREHFLFYRGVGKMDAPLRVLRKEGGTALVVQSAAKGLTIAQLWLVDIRADGSAAFRRVPRVAPDQAVATSAEFAEGSYSRENLGLLRSSIHDALVHEGLFADEADALLNTWQVSYFQNPGQRLFFLVPQMWTDAILPLSLSVPADLTRIMVGRIELVTPAQRILLHRMAQTPAPDLKNLKDVTAAVTKLRADPSRTAAYNALAGGHGDLDTLGVPVPAIYADFLALGRFRTALLLNAKEDSPALNALAAYLTP